MLNRLPLRFIAINTRTGENSGYDLYTTGISHYTENDRRVCELMEDPDMTICQSVGYFDSLDKELYIGDIFVYTNNNRNSYWEIKVENGTVVCEDFINKKSNFHIDNMKSAQKSGEYYHIGNKWMSINTLKQNWRDIYEQISKISD